MLRRTFLVGLFSLGLAAIAQAGPMYVYVVADPQSTAGAGVAAVNTMTVTSTKSGAGTFHVYAVDDVTGSFGIKSYNIKLNGVITTFLNRATNGTWQDNDAVSNAEAFNDVRTAVAGTGITSGGQNPTNVFFIKGFGIQAGNLPAVNSSGAMGSGGAPNYDGTTTTANPSGQWGTYSATLGAATSGNAQGQTAPLGDGAFRRAIFLAEGNYTGSAPTVDLVTQGATATAFNFFTSATGGAAASAPLIKAENPFVPEPATITLCGLAFVGGIGLVRRRR
jgi:hypothetical protein